MPQIGIGASMSIRAIMKEVAPALVLLIVVLQPFLIGLNQETYHGDESIYISRGVQSIGLILRGDFSLDAWWGKTPADIIMGTGSWLSGIKSGHWDFMVRPPDNVLLSARMPVAILGALSCIVLFYLGRALGGFRTGLFAALLLAFNPMWLMSSRRAMRDTPSAFFSAISVLLFYCSVERKNFKGKAILIALSGLTTGLALGSKLFAGVTLMTIAIYLVLTIIDEYHINRRVGRDIPLSLLIFVTSSLVGFVVFSPALWSDPMQYILRWFNLGQEFITASEIPLNNMAIPGDKLAAAAGIVNYVLWPIYVPNPLRHFPTCLTWLNMHAWPSPTYSTFAATSLFFVGLAYVGLRGAKKKLSHVEMLVLMWFLISFIGLLWWLPILWARYFVPLIPPLVLIEAIGLNYILRGIGQRMRYLFAGAVLATHVGSTLIGFPEYYLFHLQSLFVNSIGLTVTAAFVIFVFCITILRLHLRRKHQKSGR